MKYNITENKLKKNGYTFVNKNYRMYYKDISNGCFTIWLYTKYKVITISQWGGDIDKVIDFYLKIKIIKIYIVLIMMVINIYQLGLI